MGPRKLKSYFFGADDFQVATNRRKFLLAASSPAIRGAAEAGESA